MQIKTESKFSPQHQKLYQDILKLTKPVQESYPNYPAWYNNTFLEGLKKGERIILTAEEQGDLVGVALLKKTPQERKLCTLFVRPENRRQGIGEKLLSKTVQELGKNPLITVSEKNMKEVSSLFRRFKFHLSAKKRGVYSADVLEYYFNDEKADVIQNKFVPVLKQRIRQLKRD